MLFLVRYWVLLLLWLGWVTFCIQLVKMDEISKKKNVYDLEYNRKLNHQNIWLILIGTIGITLWFKDLWLESARLSLLWKLLGTLVLLILIIVVITYYNSELNNIKFEIKEL